ncbi:MAG: hypothetical protein Q8L34_01015 [Candidatus Woesearchaeota archaeon]|nr:hypothetical protein [Candidatus Woesearchaeota archaeon]
MKTNNQQKWNLRNFCVSALFMATTGYFLFPVVLKATIGAAKLIQDYQEYCQEYEQRPEVQAQRQLERQKRDYVLDVKGLEYQAQYCIDHAIQLRIGGYSEEEVGKSLLQARQHYTTALEMSKQSPFAHPSKVGILENELRSLDRIIESKPPGRILDIFFK